MCNSLQSSAFCAVNSPELFLHDWFHFIEKSKNEDGDLMRWSHLTGAPTTTRQGTHLPTNKLGDISTHSKECRDIDIRRPGDAERF
jgi:hypothetical protein